MTSQKSSMLTAGLIAALGSGWGPRAATLPTAAPASPVAYQAKGRAAAEPIEEARLTFAPRVPPPIARRGPAVVRARLRTSEKIGTLMDGFGAPVSYAFWTFNGRVPGPFIRVREGDTLEIVLTNPEGSSMAHSIDLHAVTGPGGGAPATLAQPGETKVARFKMLHPGLFAYHCAAPPITEHIANGMYGLILVEPAGGLPKADREYYVMQSEFYTREKYGTEGLNHYDGRKAAAETPTYVVLNGRVGALTGGNALKAKTGERVRLYFGNIGPNLISSFHVIGAVMDAYAWGALGNPPMPNVQTIAVPAGGAMVADFTPLVPGTYSMMDHSIFRMEKGDMGQIEVSGPPAPDIYQGVSSR